MADVVSADRKSEKELVSSRNISAPARLVFEAWAKPEIFQKWWVPKSAPITLITCEMDVRTGGTYRLVFSAENQTAEFFGKYIEVVPHSRLVWTNEEVDANAATITTVNLEEKNGTTLVTVHDLYPTKEALDEAIETGSAGAMPEQLEQLDQLMRERKVL